jgi:hypothetical protein
VRRALGDGAARRATPARLTAGPARNTIDNRLLGRRGSLPFNARTVETARRSHEVPR